MSYDYGTTFTEVSDKFQLPRAKVDHGHLPVISQFYHSPADNKRVGTTTQMRLAEPPPLLTASSSSSSSVSLRGLQQQPPVEHL